jgi:arylesterase/paraoxonase
MHRARRFVIVLSAVLLVGAVALILRTLDAMGVFTETARVACDDARNIPGVTGPEDMQYDAASNAVFISATDRRAWPARPSTQDGLYIYRPDQSGPPAKLKGTPADFHPHGISLYRSPDGSLTLMAVNHPAHGASSIEIFDVSDAAKPDIALHEREAIAGDLLISPNDVAAIDRDRFYATNDHTSRTGLGLWLENFVMLPRADVVYFDGASFRIVASGLHFANGINMSPDRSHIYVAETTGRAVQTYARTAFTGDLSYVSSLPIASGLDNIDVTDKGDMTVAGHPKLFDFLTYMRNPVKVSPSQIFRVSLDAQGVPQSAAPMYSGNDIGASSVGIMVRGRLLIGSVFDSKILSCKSSRSS